MGRGKNTIARLKVSRLAPGTRIPGSLKKREGWAPSVVRKAVTRARADIASWKAALRAADNVDRPRRTKLITLYDDIMLDAHLTSQVELRLQSVLSNPITLGRDGEEDGEATTMLSRASWVEDLNRAILSTPLYGHTLVELTVTQGGSLAVTVIPRANVIPEMGTLLFREDSEDGIRYREAPEFGTWVLEFGSPRDYGLLNKAIPHVLFKRFAQSCWSELCEIYGIPPRYMKTDTNDPEMLDRAERMLKDMGSAAYFVIDSTEEFQFAKGADTNGDVYNNLISLCKSELSLLVVGVVVGQDTKNGNRSKEEVSVSLLDKITRADKKRLTAAWNDTVIPALTRIGVLKEGLTFALQPEEDTEKLWAMTKEALPYLEVDPKWIKEKFGIGVTGVRAPASPPSGGGKLGGGYDFFD